MLIMSHLLSKQLSKIQSCSYSIILLHWWKNKNTEHQYTIDALVFRTHKCERSRSSEISQYLHRHLTLIWHDIYILTFDIYQLSFDIWRFIFAFDILHWYAITWYHWTESWWHITDGFWGYHSNLKFSDQSVSHTLALRDASAFRNRSWHGLDELHRVTKPLWP